MDSIHLSHPPRLVLQPYADSVLRAKLQTAICRLPKIGQQSLTMLYAATMRDLSELNRDQVRSMGAL